MIAKSPKMLLDPNFPLFLRWSYLPKLTPWLLKYLSNANDKDTRRIAQGIAPITYDTVEQHQSLTAGLEAAKWVEPTDYSFAYPDRAAFEADHYTWMLREQAGFVPDVIEAEDVRDFEPGLSDTFDLLAVMHDHGFVRDPGAYVAALAADAEKLGVEFRQTEVVDFQFADKRVSGVVTKDGTFECNDVILATGVWSGPLSRKLGIKVPLESERGYHMEFTNPENGPRHPTMVTTGKFVANPMLGRLRCAGVVEFGGLEAGPSKAPLNLLKRKVLESFPNLTFDNETSWLGHRPAPSDSLPFIGEVNGTGIYTGFGHHHIGLTAGPKTGKILSDLVTGQTPNIDLTPYNPARF
jgi:D-amino-acid dehydrogenase